ADERPYPRRGRCGGAAPVRGAGRRSGRGCAGRVVPSARGGDLPGLLRSLGADAVVVDSDEAPAEAIDSGVVDEVLVVHVALRRQRVTLIHHGVSRGGDDASIESIRNLLVGALLGKMTFAPDRP